MNTNQMNIYPSKKKILLQFVISLILIPLGFLLFKFDIYTLGGILIVAGVIVILNLSKYLIFKQPLLTIDEKGIKDNMNMPTLGFIEWENIERAEIDEITGLNNIMIYLKDSEKFISNQSFLKKPFLRTNDKNIGTCIFFRCNVFENADEVLAFIRRMIELHKK